MLMQDKKKAVTAILGEDHPNVGDRREEESPLKMAASELLQCIKDDDVEGVMGALRACYSAIGAEEPQED